MGVSTVQGNLHTLYIPCIRATATATRLILLLNFDPGMIFAYGKFSKE